MPAHLTWFARWQGRTSPDRGRSPPAAAGPRGTVQAVPRRLGPFGTAHEQLWMWTRIGPPFPLASQPGRPGPCRLTVAKRPRWPAGLADVNEPVLAIKPTPASCHGAVASGQAGLSPRPPGTRMRAPVRLLQVLSQAPTMGSRAIILRSAARCSDYRGIACLPCLAASARPARMASRRGAVAARQETAHTPAGRQHAAA